MRGYFCISDHDTFDYKCVAHFKSAAHLTCVLICYVHVTCSKFI